jgi:hypothetical protein
MTTRYGSINRRPCLSPKEDAAGASILDFEARHRRRTRLATDQGEDIPLSRPRMAVEKSAAHGRNRENNGIQTRMAVTATRTASKLTAEAAASEALVEVRHKGPSQLMRFASHRKPTSCR